MTEPVAYVKIKNGKVYSMLRSATPNDESTAVYTAEQLHPRVKMTQKQYKEWQQVINSIYPVNLYELFNLIFNPVEHRGEYAGLRDIFSFDEGQKKLAQLWIDYDSENPEETIDIVPDMKWFVRRILPNAGGNMLYCTDEGELTYNHNKEYATQFDTKEEAEKWTNPLTEAVQLPVEGDND
ncbi:hypothetical protein [Leuconostoc sp. UCMA20149]|uniref:hypothetical protein n=1 Tax=Leuconostoc sp. UCMA20149 TaxID=2583528 RepID=UPI0025B1C713|nr:hypothetical protein [Leuconostoc sp. UCMA20149]MDN2450976.1 hypothetical protein [Leuconostoc sp. UCMA20149]